MLGPAVVDTDVVVAAFRSASGASRVVLTAALQGQYRMLVSVPLMLEYESVVTRAEHLAAAGIAAADANVVLDALASVAEPVRISFLWRPILPDSVDDLVLETAVNGGAAVIVTFNRGHFVPAAARFGISIVSPPEAIRRLESPS